jgi:hypothetical protein
MIWRIAEAAIKNQESRIKNSLIALWTADVLIC